MSLYRTTPVYPEASRPEMERLSQRARSFYSVLHPEQQKTTRRRIAVALQRRNDTFTGFCFGVIFSSVGLLFGHDRVGITNRSEVAAGISSVAILGLAGFITQNAQRAATDQIPEKVLAESPGVDLSTVHMRPLSREGYIADRLSAGEEIPEGMVDTADFRVVSQYLQAHSGIDFRKATADIVENILSKPTTSSPSADIRFA